MLSNTVQDAMNAQINHELYSAYLYLSMSAQCEAQNLGGFASWLRLQSQEELSHALKFFDFVNDRGGRAVLKAIDQPPAEFKSPLALFQQVLEHERKVTGLIHQLYALAVKENDYAAQVELQWFITEQVEEEKTAGQIVDQLKMMGDQPGALFLMDRQLGQRAA